MRVKLGLQRLQRLADLSEVVKKPVFKAFSQDQFLDFLVTRVKEQLVEVPFFVCQDRVQQRTSKHFSDTLEVVEEPFFVVSQQRIIEQNIEFLVD